MTRMRLMRWPSENLDWPDARAAFGEAALRCGPLPSVKPWRQADELGKPQAEWVSPWLAFGG